MRSCRKLDISFSHHQQFHSRRKTFACSLSARLICQERCRAVPRSAIQRYTGSRTKQQSAGYSANLTTLCLPRIRVFITRSAVAEDPQRSALALPFVPPAPPYRNVIVDRLAESYDNSKTRLLLPVLACYREWKPSSIYIILHIRRMMRSSTHHFIPIAGWARRLYHAVLDAVARLRGRLTAGLSRLPISSLESHRKARAELSWQAAERESTDSVHG